MSQSLCIISTKAPYAGQSAREALDVVMVAASFEIPTSLLLMGDGVYQLLQKQQPEILPRKNLSSMMRALPMYDIETIYVDQQSLQERGISDDQLQSPFTLVCATELPAFIAKHQQVLNF